MDIDLKSIRISPLITVALIWLFIEKMGDLEAKVDYMQDLMIKHDLAEPGDFKFRTD